MAADNQVHDADDAETMQYADGKSPAPDRSFVITTVAAAALLGIVLLLHIWKDIPFGQLTKDPVALGKGTSAYTGFLSQIGIFLWSGTASVCLFCGAVLPRTIVDSRFVRFLLVSGLFTLYLGLDDVFLLHELVYPQLGIAQNYVLAGYVIITLLYLFAFRKIILATRYRLLAVSLVFFAVSVVLDVFMPFSFALTFFEDGAKLFGLVNWSAYFVRTAADAIVSPE